MPPKQMINPNLPVEIRKAIECYQGDGNISYSFIDDLNKLTTSNASDIANLIIDYLKQCEPKTENPHKILLVLKTLNYVLTKLIEEKNYQGTELFDQAPSFLTTCLVYCDSPAIIEEATRTIASVACTDAGREAIIKAGAALKLVAHLDSGTAKISEQAANALVNLNVSETGCEAIQVRQQPISPAEDLQLQYYDNGSSIAAADLLTFLVKIAIGNDDIRAWAAVIIIANVSYLKDEHDAETTLASKMIMAIKLFSAFHSTTDSEIDPPESVRNFFKDQNDDLKKEYEAALKYEPPKERLNSIKSDLESGNFANDLASFPNKLERLLAKPEQSVRASETWETFFKLLAITTVAKEVPEKAVDQAGKATPGYGRSPN